MFSAQEVHAACFRRESLPASCDVALKCGGQYELVPPGLRGTIRRGCCGRRGSEEAFVSLGLTAVTIALLLQACDDVCQAAPWPAAAADGGPRQIQAQHQVTI